MGNADVSEERVDFCFRVQGSEVVQDAAMGKGGEVDGVAEKGEFVRGFDGATSVQGGEE